MAPRGRRENPSRPNTRGSSGSHGTLALAPPRFNQLLTVCPQDSERALTFVVSPVGAALANARIVTDVSRGQLTAMTHLADGVLAATYTAPPELAIGETIAIRAQLEGAAVSQGECRAPIRGEQPSAVAISVATDAYIAGSGVPIAVTVELRYPGYRPRLRVPVALAVDFGTVSLAQRRPDGRYVTTWTLPDQLEQRQRARLTARAGSRSTGAIDVSLRPGPVARVTLTSEQVALIADGRSYASLDVAVADAYGNPVSGAQFDTSARGSVSPLKQLESGRYRATYTVPESIAGRVDTVRVTEVSSGHYDRIDLRIVPLLKPRALAVHVGYVDNLGKVSGLDLKLDISHRLPIWQYRLTAGVSVGWHKSEDRRMTDQGTEVATEVTAVPILARTGVLWPLGRVISYGSLGVGVTYSRVSIASERSGATQEDSVQFALAGDVGVGLALGPGWVTLEAGYLSAVVKATHTAGNVGGIHSSLGYRYSF